MTAAIVPINTERLEENYSTGYICLYRSLRKHWIWSDPNRLKWWIDILLECNHKDKKVLIGSDLVLCKRGECVVSILTWAKRWRTTRSSVRRFLDLLESDSMIVKKSNTKTTHLTVCNYETYNDQRPTKRPTNEHQTNIKVTTTKNDNNDNNIVAGANKPKSYKQWSSGDFISELSKFKESYPKDILNAFYKYWSEKSATGKMRLQLEKTWETPRRLENWQRIDDEKKK